MQHRFRLKLLVAACEQGGRRSKRREDRAAFRPKQIGEESAVGVTRGVDALGVDSEIGAQAFKHDIEKFQIPVSLCAGHALPARSRALGIGQFSRGRQALWIDHDRVRPDLVNRKAARRLVHGAAVTVKGEHQGPARRRRRTRGNPDQRLTRNAVDQPRARLQLRRRQRRRQTGAVPRERAKPVAIS